MVLSGGISKPCSHSLGLHVTSPNTSNIYTICKDTQIVSVLISTRSIHSTCQCHLICYDQYVLISAFTNTDSLLNFGTTICRNSDTILECFKRFNLHHFYTLAVHHKLYSKAL